MKFRRKKAAKRFLEIYKNHFGYSEPYNVIVDGTFVKSALDSKVQIFDQVKNYLGANVILYTTDCILNELKEMGKPLYGALVICKNYEKYECCHNGTKMARGCLKDIIERGNPDKLIFATRDPNVTSYANNQVGIAIMYINGNTIIMEKPSECTVTEMEKRSRNRLDLSTSEKLVLKRVKQEDQNNEQNKKGKRKKPQAPNPLSCKSKKAKSNEVTSTNVQKTSELNKSTEEGEKLKRKRKKRTKVPAHARVAVEEKLKILLSEK